MGAGGGGLAPVHPRGARARHHFFDTADVYSQGASEEILGRALKEFARRSEVVIATKVHGAMGPGANAKGLSRKHIMEGIDASLKRLGTDYVDLYQIHRFDAETPMEETMEALNDVVRAGKALYIGASSMYAWQFARMIDIARAKGHAEFVSMQNYYNLVYREEEREMMKFCAFEGIAVIPWSPMARGYLAGSGLGESASTVRGRTDPFSAMLGLGSRQDEAIRKRVVETAEKLGTKPAVVALAWVLSKPYVTAPIIGASKPHHLADAVAATELKLDARTIAKLEEPYQPKAVAGHVVGRTVIPDGRRSDRSGMCEPSSRTKRADPGSRRRFGFSR